MRTEISIEPHDTGTPSGERALCARLLRLWFCFVRMAHATALQTSVSIVRELFSLPPKKSLQKRSTFFRAYFRCHLDLVI